MFSRPYTLGWAFTFLLCFTLFNGAWGDCGPPPVKPNTIPVQEISGTTGQTVVYTCDRDTGYYEIPEKSTTVTCQSDDTWTNIEDFCTRACGVPDRLPYAEPKPGALNQNIFLPNAVVAYVCRPGYTRVPGKRSLITCSENYTWSEPDVFCNRKSCGNPGEVENGNIEATDFLFGSRVTYTCIEGYRLISRRNFRDCQADGSWSNVLPQCDAVVCAAPEKPANGEYHLQKDEYTYLDSVTFSCQEPLKVVGNASISCTATGQWSSNSPTCKAVNCPNPDVKNSRRRSGFIGPYTLNSGISFVCDKGFILRGSSLVSCNIDSQWVPAVPQCERISCGDPGTIPNGERFAPDFYVGSKATYTCIDGYSFPFTLLKTYRVCQENGAWSDSSLVCTAICKEKPRIPSFALFQETSTIYFNGTVLHFECIPGFKRTDKENTITCSGNSWSDPDEFCTRISCGHPGRIKNGYVSAPDYLFGSRAIYTCEEGYERNTTQNFTECQENGRWSTAIACQGCKTCKDAEREEEPEDASSSKVLSVGAIIGISFGVAASAGVICFLLLKYIGKKQKRGEYYCDVKTDKFAASVEPEL